MKDPVKVERDLMALVPVEEWTIFSHRLIWFGRGVHGQGPALRPLRAGRPLPVGVQVGRFVGGRYGSCSSLTP